MSVTRRELCSLLPLTMIASAFAMEDAGADTKLASHIYNFQDLPMHQGKGVQTRPILKGTTATGELVEVHETMLEPGGAPHPPHHRHSEFWLVREGTIEITI